MWPWNQFPVDTEGRLYTLQCPPSHNTDVGQSSLQLPISPSPTPPPCPAILVHCSLSPAFCIQLHWVEYLKLLEHHKLFSSTLTCGDVFPSEWNTLFPSLYEMHFSPSVTLKYHLPHEAFFQAKNENLFSLLCSCSHLSFWI